MKMNSIIVLCVSILTCTSAKSEDSWVNVGNLEFAAIGGTATSGDCEMDTDHSDVVPADCKTELKIDNAQNGVVLTVKYKCTEHGGGGKHSVIEVQKSELVYRAPQDMTIVEVKAEGGLIQSFSSQTRGRNWKWNSYGTVDTYWKKLEFKVDDRGGEDCDKVGVRGELAFRVKVAAKK